MAEETPSKGFHYQFAWLPADYTRMIEAAIQVLDNRELAQILVDALDLQQKILFHSAHNRDQLRALARTITDYINGVPTPKPFTPQTFSDASKDAVEEFARVQQLYEEYMGHERILQEIYSI